VNEKSQLNKRIFEKGMSVELIVEAGRFLPDNTTVSKVEVSIMNREKRRLVGPESGVAVLSSDCLNPFYNLKVNLRLPHLEPTLIAIITLITIDKSDR
jgi:diaminopimelate decarboxylase